MYQLVDVFLFHEEFRAKHFPLSLEMNIVSNMASGMVENSSWNSWKDGCIIGTVWDTMIVLCHTVQGT